MFRDLPGYTAPKGFYELVKATPFLGSVHCSESELIAGSWHELLLTYTVGGSGLADGAWIKATFKFYSDWALFQTSAPTAPNYVSAEYEAAPLLPGQVASTVQSLSVRFDQKGHERPFQKSVIVDIIDGFLNVGDKIHLRLGDRRAGGAGTRIQTFVEKDFRFRFYVDPVGTSRFAQVPDDVVLQIVPGAPVKTVVIATRLMRQGTTQVIVRLEDAWGNTVVSRPLSGVLYVDLEPMPFSFPETGWATKTLHLDLSSEGTYRLTAKVENLFGTALITVDESSPVPRIFYGDLHVHSDDTVGTNDSLYNFSYAKECAGLDVVGYTANDFNITKENWDATVTLVDSLNKSDEFVIYPGTEWCGNTAVGGDHNVVFLGEDREFPFDRHGKVARSFEWNDQMATDQLTPGTWPIDELYAIYSHKPESHLLIPHIGGRRANLGWHHPTLERLIEVGSAWGHFEWFLKDAISRGYRLGVSANSDEHRGRCGGGVPGTAVFGTRGGLTGILSDCLDRPTVGQALRARRTFATTGQRLVGLIWLEDRPEARQGDEVDVRGPVKLAYRFLGQSGWESIEAHGWDGTLLHRNLHAEVGASRSHIRVSWGGARIKDRYREAKWRGRIFVRNGTIRHAQRMSPDDVHPEETHWTSEVSEISFESSTSGDRDGLMLNVDWFGESGKIEVEGEITGYVKVGDPLKPKPYKHVPTFDISACEKDLPVRRELGGTDMFVAIERVSEPGTLPYEVSGVLDVPARNGPHGAAPVWFSALEVTGAKVWTSAIWLKFEE